MFKKESKVDVQREGAYRNEINRDHTLAYCMKRDPSRGLEKTVEKKDVNVTNKKYLRGSVAGRNS
jgi:hypothetical protein